MDLISVIVPVYKAEPYLDRCVQSIVDQTYTNLEIILVDDGSPDHCPQMCDEWAKRDSRIRVIHKENSGGGGARNAALDVACGEYIGMVDSDDYIASNMYEHLLGLMSHDVDIVECDIYNTVDDNAVLDGGKYTKNVMYSVQEAMKLHIQDSLFRQTPPNKLYRRSVIANIRFPVGTRIDDEFWTYRVIANSRKLVHTFCNMYAYRQQSESVMHLSFSLERLQALEAKSQRLEFIKTLFPELVSLARINLWYTCLFMGQMSLIHMKKNECEIAYKKILETRKKYPLTKVDKEKLPLKQYIWTVLSEVSFSIACQLRNRLKIGV